MIATSVIFALAFFVLALATATPVLLEGTIFFLIIAVLEARKASRSGN